MAKIFYVTETTPDYAQVNFFKTEKEALEYGISELPQFDMFGEPTNDEEADGDEWYQGDSLTFKKGILFSFEGGGTFVQAMEDAEAREYAEDLGDEGGAIFFEGFKNGMYGYLGNGADGSNIKWDWDGQEINESTSTGRLKHVKLFEQFVNENFSKKDAKQLIKDLKADGLDASGDENWIQVDGVDSPNPNYDGTVSMAWDPIAKEAYSDDDTYTEPVETVEDFMDILNYPEDTMGMWE